MAADHGNRVDRARRGSRRKRDRAALADVAREVVPPLPAGVELTEGSQDAWQCVVEAITDRLPESTWRIWIDPIKLVGEADGALCVYGPPKCVTWVRRRYGVLLGDLVREHSDYRGVFIAFIADGPEQGQEGDGCL